MLTIPGIKFASTPTVAFPLFTNVCVICVWRCEYVCMYVRVSSCVNVKNKVVHFIAYMYLLSCNVNLNIYLQCVYILPCCMSLPLSDNHCVF